MVWLDNSRILAIFAVVFLHSAAHVVVGNEIGSENWWIGNIYDSAVRWCVPVFVMVSGALLLDPRKQEDINIFYRKRLSRILFPIIFWSLFFLLWSSLKGAMKGKPLTILELVKNLASGKPYYHLWFLYMIAPLYLVTPFLRKIISASSRNEIKLLVVISFVVVQINNIANFWRPDNQADIFINWFLSYIPYFLLGYLIQTDDSGYPRYILWGIFVSTIILTAIGCWTLATKEGLTAGLYFYNYFSVTVIPMSISALYILKTYNKPIAGDQLTKLISKLTLGVYLIHPITLEIIEHGFRYLAPLSPALAIPIKAISVFVTSLILAAIIGKNSIFKRII